MIALTEQGVDPIECSLIITPETVKGKNTNILNMTCAMHVHTRPDEFMMILIGVKEAATRDEALERVVDVMCKVADKLELTVRDVKVVDPRTCGIVGEKKEEE